MRENVKFVLKVTAAHVATYLVCGLIFARLFDYESLFAIDGARDPGAFAVMFAALAAVFGMTVAYAAPKKRLPAPVYYIVCYLALAAAPTAYNYLTGSPLRSPLSLVFSGLPVAAIGVYFRAKRSKARTTEIPR